MNEKRRRRKLPGDPPKTTTFRARTEEIKQKYKELGAGRWLNNIIQAMLDSERKK